MSSEVKKFWKQQLKRTRIAVSGIGLAMKEKHFWIVAVPVFVLFGILLNLLSSGTAGVTMLFSGDAENFWRMLSKAFLAIFGIGRNFSDFLLTFVILLLQTFLLGTLAVVIKHAKDDNVVTFKEADQAKTGLQNSGLVAGLAILGSGCPTCGTALITPVLGTIFSTGGFAMAGLVSGVITALAIIVALFSLRAIGVDAYAAILKVCPAGIKSKPKKG